MVWDWWKKQHKLMEQQTNLTWVYLAVLHSLNVHQLPRMIKYFSENIPCGRHSIHPDLAFICESGD